MADDKDKKAPKKAEAARSEEARGRRRLRRRPKARRGSQGEAKAAVSHAEEMPKDYVPRLRTAI